MIALNGHTWRTLDDKMYFNGTQIGKVYLNNQLIYPESGTITIDDIVIDTTPYRTNGNMYDTGYAPTKNTCFELCFNAKNANGAEFFGTHHDNLITPAYTYFRNNDGSKGNQYGSGTTGVSDSRVGGYKNRTKFHILLNSSQNFFSFRYGKEQDSGTQGEHDINTTPQDEKMFFVTFDENDKFYAGTDLGPFYYANKGEQHDFSRWTKANIDRSDFNQSESGGNIWINGINSKTKAPNASRPLTQSGDDSDIVFYHNTTNSAYIYLVLWEKGSPNSKVLYKQRMDNDEVVFDKYVIDTSTGKFNPTPVDVIRSFKYCRPSTT